MKETESKDDWNNYYDEMMKVLKSYMKDCDMTQKAMAMMINMKLTSFCNKINNSNGKFNILELYKITQELFITIDDLTFEAMAKIEKKLK